MLLEAHYGENACAAGRRLAFEELRGGALEASVALLPYDGFEVPEDESRGQQIDALTRSPGAAN